MASFPWRQYSSQSTLCGPKITNTFPLPFHQNFSKSVTMQILEYGVPQKVSYSFLQAVNKFFMWLCPVACIEL
jgi:hypothetical protein